VSYQDLLPGVLSGSASWCYARFESSKCYLLCFMLVSVVLMVTVGYCDYGWLLRLGLLTEVRVVY
jgi:hypothetical protein